MFGGTTTHLWPRTFARPLPSPVQQFPPKAQWATCTAACARSRPPHLYGGALYSRSHRRSAHARRAFGGSPRPGVTQPPICHFLASSNLKQSLGVLRAENSVDRSSHKAGCPERTCRNHQSANARADAHARMQAASPLCCRSTCMLQAALRTCMRTPSPKSTAGSGEEARVAQSRACSHSSGRLCAKWKPRGSCSDVRRHRCAGNAAVTWA